MPRDAGHGSVEPLFRVIEYDYVWLCHRSVLNITLTAGGVPRRRRMEADRMAAPAVPNVRRYRPAGLHDAAESEARRFAREPRARARAKTDRGHPRSRPDVARSGTGGASRQGGGDSAASRGADGPDMDASFRRASRRMRETGKDARNQSQRRASSRSVSRASARRLSSSR